MQKMAARGYALPPQKYKKQLVIDTLKKNRDEHAKEYEAAVAEYKKAAADLIKKKKAFFLKELKTLSARIEGSSPADGVAKLEFPAIYHSLKVPVSYGRHYDQAIAQLEQSLDDTVELDDVAYACFMEDNWDWRLDFDTVTESYGVSKSDQRWLRGPEALKTAPRGGTLIRGQS